MPHSLGIILAVVSAYLVGSIPTSFILAKILKGIDIRKIGSGNVGATNVFRTIGNIPALVALTLDILKGVFAVTILAGYLYSFAQVQDYTLYKSIMALAAICGHIWPIFLNFKGGKGIATTIGVVLSLSPKVFISSFSIWLIVFFISKYVSLASIAFAIALPIFAAVLAQPFYIIVLCITICILTSYRHKNNINRLLRGEEPKTLLKNRKK